MFSFITKANKNGAEDSRSATTQGALEQNSINTELMTVVTDSGQSLTDYSTQTDTNTNQLAVALGHAGRAAAMFQDSGTANTIQLTPETDIAFPTSTQGGYDLLDKNIFIFVPAYTNTGNTTINVGGSSSGLLGSKSAFDIDGNELDAGALTTDSYYIFKYDASADSSNGAFILIDSVDRASTTSIAGKVRLATTTEATTGTATDIAVTPAGVAAAISANSAVVQGNFKNLVGSADETDATGTYTADELVAKDSSGNALLISGLSATFDTSASGAGGLDTGTIAASTWYSVWAISNGTDVALLLSTATALSGLTFPSGYTYAVRVGWIRTDASTYPMAFTQRGVDVDWVQDADTLLFASGYTGTSADPELCDISAYVPSTATSVHGGVAGYNNGEAALSTGNQNIVHCYVEASGKWAYSNGYVVLLSAQQLYYGSTSSNCYGYIFGWRDNL